MADRSLLETFPNPHPARNYLIEHVADEFTSMCPNTGQPDFGSIHLSYVPDASCVELKSLKQYLQSFRSDGVFYEDATNLILDDLMSCCRPRWMLIRSTWRVRGGIYSVITAEHGSRTGPNPPASST